MISTLDVLTAAAAAIRASTDIATFCTATYSATLTIYIGEDRVNPPGEANAPFVILTPGLMPYDLGTDVESRRPTFEADWGVLNSTQTLTDSNNTVTQDGLTNSDTLGQLITAALQDAFTGDSGDHLATVNYLLYGAAPLWCGGASITLHYEQGMGEATL